MVSQYLNSKLNVKDPLQHNLNNCIVPEIYILKKYNIRNFLFNEPLTM